MSDRKPRRVQLRRVKGWKMPPNTMSVARPSRWGNPFRVGQSHPAHGWPMSREEAIKLHRAGAKRTHPDTLAELRGKNLACWCALDQPCHADVLLELANA